MAASANAPRRSPATVPSSDIAPGVPGFTRRSVVTRNVDRPQALPISLATVSLPPAVSAATSASTRAGASGVVAAAIAADGRDAAVRDRIAGAAAAAALFGDPEVFLALQAEPRRDRRDQKRDKQQHPRARAAAGVDDRADQHAARRARIATRSWRDTRASR